MGNKNKPLEISAGIFDIINSLLIITPWLMILIDMFSSEEFYAILLIMLIIFPVLLMFIIVFGLPIILGIANIVVGIKKIASASKPTNSSGLTVYSLIVLSVCNLFCCMVVLTGIIDYANNSGNLTAIIIFGVTALTSTVGILLNALCFNKKSKN